MISTRFWNDGWVRKLNPLDRYLFLYLLTNEHTNICGIYELPMSTMAFETGIDERDLEKSMLPRLAPKMHYFEDHVVCVNFPKHQNINSPKVVIGIANELKDIPKSVLEYAIRYGYPIDTQSHLNLIKSNLIKYKDIPYSVEFESFWKEYPNKVNKKKAGESWAKVMKNGMTVEDIMAGLARSKKSDQWTKDDGQYVPHPTTWLNQERWTDEVKMPITREVDVF